MDMFINDKYTCSSKAVYGDGGSGHSHGGAAASSVPASEVGIKTINSMTTCAGPFPVKKGDSLSMVVEYDLKKYPL